MFTKINNTRIYFDIEGGKLSLEGKVSKEKPVLLLIHGGPGSDHQFFREFFPRFADSAQIIYLDLRGSGNSDTSTPQHWNLAQWVKDIEAFCRELGIHHPVIFGHSFGGMLAMKLAIDYPALPASLILAHSIGKFDMPSMLKRFERLGGETAMLAAKNFWINPNPETLADFKVHASPVYNRRWPKNIFDISSRVKNNPEVSMHFWADEGQQFDLLDQLKHIQCPCLVFGGDSDPFSGEDDIKLIANALPEKHVENFILKDCGHFFWWDAAEMASEKIEAFFKSGSG
ncbi:MAG: alpha/beta hydrolase [Pseudomonadales bacterium]|nr:alpha/beta hydrolase [Pseudomonadales bacterium]